VKYDETGRKIMKRLKDFFYDKNDILIALIILAIAALLIIWRMDIIMAYPQTLAEETGTVDTTETHAVDSDEESGTTGDSGENSSGQGSEDSLWTDGTLSKDVTVTVQGGSATAAVQSLIDAGLFTSYEEFEQVCNAAGYKPENIKATTFTFQSGSTQTDIAKMVTQ